MIKFTQGLSHPSDLILKKKVSLDSIRNGRKVNFIDFLPKSSTQKLDKSLMDVCSQFESLFLEKVFKSARQALSDKNIFGDDKSFTEKWATDQLYQVYSKNLSRSQSLGLARQIYDQLA